MRRLLEGTLNTVAWWEAGKPLDTRGRGGRSRPNCRSPGSLPTAPAVSPTAPAARAGSAATTARRLRNGPARTAAGQGATTVDIGLEEVRRVARERADGLTLDAPITELGMDSLERMEIVAALEERFGGRFPEEVLPEMITCRQVVEAVERYLGGVERPATIRPANYQTPGRILPD